MSCFVCFVFFCFFVCFYVVLPFQRYSTLFVILECFRPQKYIYIYIYFLFSVQHFITVCNIICANGGRICISIKYMITIWKHVAEFHVYFSWRSCTPLFALRAPSWRKNIVNQGLSSLLSQAVHVRTLTWNQTLSLQVCPSQGKGSTWLVGRL